MAVVKMVNGLEYVQIGIWIPKDDYDYLLLFGGLTPCIRRAIVREIARMKRSGLEDA